MAFSDYARLVRSTRRRTSMRPAPHDLVDENFIFTHGVTPSQLFARFGA
ncbi:MAG: hypothetical protein JSV07_01615 [Acidimicrobiia bacterium]|nr:MAG: hypothetical protein JSV07_01615 [Acidimicrobiia bacterium]